MTQETLLDSFDVIMTTSDGSTPIDNPAVADVLEGILAMIMAGSEAGFTATHLTYISKENPLAKVKVQVSLISATNDELQEISYASSEF